MSSGRLPVPSERSAKFSDVHPYGGRDNEPLKHLWRLKCWEVEPGRIPDSNVYWSAQPVRSHWGKFGIAPNGKSYEFHFCPPPWFISPETSPYDVEVHNVYVSLDMTESYRIWDSQEFDHLQLPLQIILNDLSQHLAKVAGRIAGVAAGE